MNKATRKSAKTEGRRFDSRSGRTASRVASSLALEDARTEALEPVRRERESRPVGNSFEEARLESVDLGSERAERPDASGRRSSISSMGSRR